MKYKSLKNIRQNFLSQHKKWKHKLIFHIYKIYSLMKQKKFKHNHAGFLNHSKVLFTSRIYSLVEALSLGSINDPLMMPSFFSTFGFRLWWRLSSANFLCAALNLLANYLTLFLDNDLDGFWSSFNFVVWFSLFFNVGTLS